VRCQWLARETHTRPAHMESMGYRAFWKRKKPRPFLDGAWAGTALSGPAEGSRRNTLLDMTD